MSKALRIILLIVLIVTPLIFYKVLNTDGERGGDAKGKRSLPKIALIFDDLGESLSDLREIYSLDIPLTISVIPNLKFSKNIAHIASRCGFSVFIHLPLEPSESTSYKTNKYQFISASLSNREIRLILKQYLNSLRIAIGVNNHMGSKATQDEALMDVVLDEIKKKSLIFVDSRTSLESVAYNQAHKKNLVCGYSEGFLDSVDSLEHMSKKMDELIAKANSLGKIIIIAHPREGTLKFLKKELPVLQKKVEFITIKDYFDL